MGFNIFGLSIGNNALRQGDGQLPLPRVYERMVDCIKTKDLATAVKVAEEALKDFDPAAVVDTSNPEKRQKRLMQERIFLLYASILIQDRQSKGSLQWKKIDKTMAALKLMNEKNTYISGSYFRLKYSSIRLYEATVRAEIGVRDDRKMAELEQEITAAGAQIDLNMDTIEDLDPRTIKVPYLPNGAADEAYTDFFFRAAQAYRLLAEYHRGTPKEARYQAKCKKMLTLTKRGDSSYMPVLKDINKKLDPSEVKASVRTKYNTVDTTSDTTYSYTVKEGANTVPVDGNTVHQNKKGEEYSISVPVTWQPVELPRWTFGIEPGVVISHIEETQDMYKYVRMDHSTVPDPDNDTYHYSNSYTTYSPTLGISLEYTPFTHTPLFGSDTFTVNKFSVNASQNVMFFQDHLPAKFYDSSSKMPVDQKDMWNYQTTTGIGTFLDISPKGYEDILSFRMASGVYWKHTTHTDGIASESVSNNETTYRVADRSHENDFGFYNDLSMNAYFKNWDASIGYAINLRNSPYRDTATGDAVLRNTVFEQRIPLNVGYTFQINDSLKVRTGVDAMFKLPTWSSSIDIPAGDAYNKPLESVAGSLSFDSPLGLFTIRGGVKNTTIMPGSVYIKDSNSETMTKGGNDYAPFIEFGWSIPLD